jgi:uncharacterized repeat protein (TIGR01451 family)
MSSCSVAALARAVIVAVALFGLESPLRAQSASLSLTKADEVDPVQAGANLAYTLTVSNEGPDDALDVSLSDLLPLGTSFVSMASPAGWTCSNPPGSVSCSVADLPPGSAVLTLTVTVDPALADGTVLTNIATVTTATSDPSPDDNEASAETTVASTTVAVSIAKSDSPDPVAVSGVLTYTITATNGGPNSLELAELGDPLPAGTTFVSLGAPAGWSCQTPPVAGTGTVDCTIGPWPPGAAVFTLAVAVAELPANTQITNNVALVVDDSGRTTTFPASATTAVLAPALLTATKTVSGDFRQGHDIAYSIVLSNAGPATQPDAPGDELVDVLPAALALTGASASSGVANADTATNVVTWNGAIPPDGSVTITVQATVSVGAAPGSTVANQATLAYDADGNGTNEASGASDDPATPPSNDPTSFVVGAAPIGEIPTLGRSGLLALAAALALAGAWLARGGRAS